MRIPLDFLPRPQQIRRPNVRTADSKGRGARSAPNGDAAQAPNASARNSKAAVETKIIARPIVVVVMGVSGRRPWLEAIAAVIAGWIAEGQPGVVTCSALKRACPQIIIGDNPTVRLVYLRASWEMILRRMTARHGHFMPVSLLDSQFRTLEEPAPEEHAIVISIARNPEEIVVEIVAALATQ
jgi:carbohydrate kinase (thermoresistant glucokinase family)